MDRFQYLTRKREGAISLFGKVVRRLNKVEDEIRGLIGDAERGITDAQAEIDRHRNDHAYLCGELEQTEKSRRKIEQLLT